MSNSVVQSPSEQCIDHIVTHLEEYPSSYLVLLPLLLCEAILWRLPMADVCRLEETEFVKGIKTEDYWSSTFLENDNYILPDYDWMRTSKYFEEHWQSGSVKRAIVCGSVFGLAFGFCDFNQTGFHVGHSSDMVLVTLSLMFRVREEVWDYWNEINRKSSGAIPPRYQQYSVCNSKEDLLRAVMECFRGDLPSYLYTECLEEAACDNFFYYVPYFKNLRYLELQIRKLGPKVQELIIRITREAANLEVLVPNYDPPCEDEHPIPLQSLDGVILELAQSSFASHMHMLVAFTCFGEPDVDVERGFFTMSCDALKKFLKAFLCAPSDHCQLLHLEGTTVACNNLQELCALL